MRQQTAIDLLEHQKKRINCDKLKREEWIVSTTAVLMKVFPLSARSKIRQIERLNEIPDFYSQLSPQQRTEITKRKAEAYLNNYIEEIELLDTESRSDKLDVMFKSPLFWVVIICVGLSSFVAGNRAAKIPETQKLDTQEIFSPRETTSHGKLLDSLIRMSQI